MKENYIKREQKELSFARMILNDAPPKDVAKNRALTEFGMTKAAAEKAFKRWDENRRQDEEMGAFATSLTKLQMDEHQFRLDLLERMYGEVFDHTDNTRDHNKDLQEINTAKTDAWITTALGVCERLDYADLLTRGESLFPNVFAKDEDEA